jgi:phage protein D
MPLAIPQLEQNYGDFYVPLFKVLVDGKDLLSDLFLEISTVQVDNTLKGADRFSFTVNSTFNFQNREFAHLDDLFKFGNSVEIHFGYRDVRSLTLIHRGLITAVQTSFPASGLPQINVSGYDLSYCMTKGKRSRNWDKKKDSDVVALIAREHGLTAITKDTRVELAKIEQSQESDFEFIEKLAERNGFEFYTFNDKLYFRPPANNEEAVVTLEWGKGLVSFSPEINISEQISKVEVRGWDVANKKEIVGTAQAGDEPGRDANRSSGADVIKSLCKDAGELKIRIPVYSLQEAKQHAEGVLKKRAEQFVQGGGESIGVPDILADKNIQLLGLGKKFSRTYYVEQSTHTLSTSGYRTTFKVKDTTI